MSLAVSFSFTQYTANQRQSHCGCCNYTCTGFCSIEIQYYDVTILHMNSYIWEVFDVQLCFVEFVGSCVVLLSLIEFISSAPGGPESSLSSENYHS